MALNNVNGESIPSRTSTWIVKTFLVVWILLAHSAVPIGLEVGTLFGFRYLGAAIGGGIASLIASPAYARLGLFRRWND